MGLRACPGSVQGLGVKVDAAGFLDVRVHLGFGEPGDCLLHWHMCEMDMGSLEWVRIWQWRWGPSRIRKELGHKEMGG